jgi:hypothetical protein
LSKKTKAERLLIPLPCPLTDDEKIARSLMLAEALDRRNQLDLERKDTMAEFKDREAKLDSEIGRLGTIVRGGKELRQVECEDQHNYKNGTADRVRLDTGEVVQTRPLTEEERQQELPV